MGSDYSDIKNLLMNNGNKDSTTESDRVFKVMIVAPTCFYYQGPLFQELAAHPRIDLRVVFCSQEALHSEDVAKTFNSDNTWDSGDGLLSGFEYEFLKNWAPQPSYLRWPHGLMNFAIWNRIKHEKPDAVILMAWVNITWWLAILACVYNRIPFLYMTDSNIAIEQGKSWWKRWVKKVILSEGIFPAASGFLCSGTANKSLYSYYGVNEERLFQFAYSWGYESLREKATALRPRREEIREQLGIRKDQRVVLYCGRLSPEKNLFHLIEAFKQVKSEDKLLILVGDDPLRAQLENIAAEYESESVRFFGFQNRQNIPEFYTAADLLVLPSAQETWGIVVNEGLCFGLPVIVSDQVGSASDLISEGENGYIYPVGDIAALTNLIGKVIDLNENKLTALGSKSQEIIDSWLDRNLGDLLVNRLETIGSWYSPKKGVSNP